MIEIRLSRKEKREGIRVSQKLVELGFTQFHGEWDSYKDDLSDYTVFKFYPTKSDLLTKRFEL